MYTLRCENICSNISAHMYHVMELDAAEWWSDEVIKPNTKQYGTDGGVVSILFEDTVAYSNLLAAFPSSEHDNNNDHNNDITSNNDHNDDHNYEHNNDKQ